MRESARTNVTTVLLVFLCSFAAPGTALAAGGAYAVDDSEIGKPGDCKVESWLSHAFNKAGDIVATTSPACVVNLGHPVEVGGQYQRTRADTEWGTSAGAKAKTTIISAETNKIGIGLAGAVNFDLLTHQASSYSINVPVTLQITEQFRINVNGGYLHENKGDLDWTTWGVGFEWNFVKPITLIAELYGQRGRLAEAEPDAAPTPESIRGLRSQAGLRFTPQDKVDLDLIYGRNITGENTHWFTIGLNVRF